MVISRQMTVIFLKRWNFFEIRCTFCVIITFFQKRPSRILLEVTFVLFGKVLENVLFMVYRYKDKNYLYFIVYWKQFQFWKILLKNWELLTRDLSFFMNMYPRVIQTKMVYGWVSTVLSSELKTLFQRFGCS